MRLLLDTHVAVWAVSNSLGLPGHIRELIADPIHEVYVSAVSILEIAIKRASSGRDPPPFSGAEAMDYFRQVGFALLDVTPEHAAGVEKLPMIHRDPFDRLLVAQCLAEPLRLVTHDQKVAAYSDTIMLF